MKKSLGLLTGMTALLLVACQNNTQPTQETTTQPTEETTTTASNDLKNGLADTSKGLYIIVNKKHKVGPEYAPGENPEAGEHVRALIQAMQQQGFAINDNYSGYRSYEYQTTLYNNYVSRDGVAAADRYSARPGYSEHQTGLAFDILNASGALLGDGENDGPAIEWLHSHMHEYGFVLRFPEGKEDSTGYQAEAWHVRYVGDIATDIYNSGKTLEEYFNVEGGGYE